MADVNYIPTFRHTDWVDKFDRVSGDDLNGVNPRFRAIQSDLAQFSTVVGQIGTAITEFRTPVPQTQVLTLHPVLRRIPLTSTWGIDTDGAAVAGVHESTASGVMNLTLPDRVRLTTLRVLGTVASSDPGTTGTFTLSRTPLLVSLGGGPVDQLAQVKAVGVAGTFDLQATADTAFNRIDTISYRYFITADFQVDLGPSTMTVGAIQLTVAPV